MPNRVRRDAGQHHPNGIWMLRSRPKMTLRVAQQSFEDDAEAGVLELLFAAREEDRIVVAELLQSGPVVWVELRPLSCDVPSELLTGVGRAPDRLAYRVLAFVAYEGSHINTDLRVVGHTQASGGESQNLRDARTTLQHNAQDDGLTGWRVIDHVAHPGQDRQSCGLGVARHRRLKWLHSHLEETDRLAGRVGT